MTDPSQETAQRASRRIDARIAEFDDWRGRTLARVRALIREDDDIDEAAFKRLIQAAVALNTGAKRR